MEGFEQSNELTSLMLEKDPFAAVLKIHCGKEKAEARILVRRLLDYFRGELLAAGSTEK